MASITYSIRSTTTNKLSTISLRFKDSDRIDIKLAVNYLHCFPSDFRKGKCKLSSYKVHSNDDDTLNVTLEKLRKFILDDFNLNKESISNEKLWLKQLIEKFNNKDEKQDLDDFVFFLDFYLDEKAKTVKTTTFKKLKTEVNKFKKFVTDNIDYFGAGKIIRFKDFDENFLRKYESYLESLDYQPETYSKKVKILKQICVFAKQHGINVNDAIFYWKFKAFKKTTDAKFIYLNFEELKTISELELTADYLDNARDWLLISCFTGQRISDFLEFTIKNVKTSSDINFIEFKQNKTQKLMKIPILSEVQVILDKRDGDFPRRISDVNFNLYIKEVCKKAGIIENVFGGKTNQGFKNRKIYDTYPKYKLVTSHIGRRSFATNYYRQLDIDTLMYVTGHSSQKQFLDYIQKTNEERGIEVAQAFKKLESGN
ncbi:site-specific integrase [Empedobacter brevis]|uniref:site-specific integrase n=1 Tax=Empedobacter brevis TaxID=247 RepID=UPI002FE271DB